MKKEIRSAVFSLLLMMLAVSPAYSGEAMENITGKVKDVDLAEKSIVVGGQTGDMVLYIESDSAITKGSEAKSLKDVKLGSVIRVTYVQAGDEKQVKSISLNN